MLVCRKSVGRAFAAFAAALTLSIAAPAQPASAQNFFEAIFGGIDRAIRGEPQPRAMSYADHSRYDDRDDSRRERRVSSGSTAEYAGPGPSSGYCVRTCDGKYFPVRTTGHMTATELCRSFCPTAPTKVFGGGRIDYATAGDGTRYADMPTAFLFRERTVPGCTCNGKTAGGLMPLPPENDPTLRPGDIVATNNGLVTYTSGAHSKNAEFTPIDRSNNSSEWRRRLMSIKVAPTPQRAEETPAPQPAAERKTKDKTAERLDLRSTQR